MKKVIFAAAFLFIGFTGFSQEASSAYKAKTIELIELNSGPQFDVMIKPIVNMVPEGNREAFKAEVKSSMGDLYEQLAAVYMESYTEEDVDAILAFYNTPVGKKMISEIPTISEKSMAIGQAWGMKLQPLMAKYAQ
ncbi:DUF2059 domain-containing protein [Gillisia sp. M10.2A]|uniref:DUF2059 domain-containing protein n=1 Tax=Gillisia lutea TaxID=2909668 RepID=A0ABS9EIE0_9FLAO|nr:DUF2059 domain-containing protein [Gillisia lutea]MCF4102621.1 DUF2059 domain-containing protein [Gillisia lutea]